VLGAVSLRRIPPPVAAGAGWAGLAVLIWAAFSIDGSMAYPGLWALAPTLAAALMIVSGMTRGGPGILLATGPLRFLGRISYSLYLWHWPILVLPVAMIEGELPPEARIALIGLAVAVAWASWRFIEEPFRAGFPVLARRPGRTILAGVTAIALVVSTAGGLASAGGPGAWDPGDDTSAIEAGIDPDAEPIDVDLTDPGQADALAPDAPPSNPSDSDDPGVPPGTPGPTGTPTPDATPSPTPRTYIRLPSDVRPTLANVRADEERLRKDGCLAFEGATKPRDCVYGNKEAAVTVALVGDSHAAQWFPALERAARTRGWRILTFVKVACPFVDMRVRNISLKREYSECAAWNDATIARLREARPDLTIVSMSRFAIHPVLDRDTTIVAQAAALARMLERLPGSMAVLVDTPDGAGTSRLPVTSRRRCPRRCHRPEGRVRTEPRGDRAGGRGGDGRHPDRPHGTGLPRRSVPGGGRRHDRVQGPPAPDGPVLEIARAGPGSRTRGHPRPVVTPDPSLTGCHPPGDPGGVARAKRSRSAASSPVEARCARHARVA
jgi:hypothetical protein